MNPTTTPTKPAPNTKPAPAVTSGTYFISPGPTIVATLTVNPKAYLRVVGADGKPGPKVQSASVGSLTSSAGASLQVVVHSDNGYADGQISIQYVTSSQTAWCSVDFLLGHATPWDVAGSSGQNPSILNYSSTTPNNIAVSVPASGSGGSGIAWLCQPLNTSMVFMVDNNATTGNMLFRGNCPLALPTTADGQQSIDFQAVHDILAKRYKEATGDAFYTIGDYIFNDVNLQGPVSEALYLRWEIESMGGTHESQLANQAWYPTTGHYTDAATGMNCRMVNYAVNPDATAGSPLDSFDQGCAQNLSTWMNTAPATGHLPNVYYIHCASGHDRTGIVASTYLLINYPTLTLDQAFIHGTTVSKLASGSGQLQPTCTVISGPNKGNTSTHFSRVMMIADAYNETVENIYNTVKNNTGKNIASLDAQSTATNPAYVYDTYPWPAT